jgi:hypothetical protein
MGWYARTPLGFAARQAACKHCQLSADVLDIVLQKTAGRASKDASGNLQTAFAMVAAAVAAAEVNQVAVHADGSGSNIGS